MSCPIRSTVACWPGSAKPARSDCAIVAPDTAPVPALTSSSAPSAACVEPAAVSPVAGVGGNHSDGQ